MAESQGKASPSVGSKKLSVDEVVYGSGFFQALQVHHYNQPEKRLLLALLEDAVDDIQRYRNGRGKGEQGLFNEAYAWMFSDNPRYVFSFISACHHLNLDPGYLRKGMKKWLEKNP